jgi:hypothetical protein
MGSWVSFPDSLVNLGIKKSLFQLQSMVFAILLPFVFGVTAYHSIKFGSSMFFQTLMFILLTSFSNTLFYIFARPLKPENIPYSMKKQHLKTPRTFWLVLIRFFDWLLITPVLALFTYTMSLCVKYTGLAMALFRPSNGWGTR